MKQPKMSVKEYINEFYRISIRSRQIEERKKYILRYVNGYYAIQDEFTILNFHSVAEAY